MIQKGKKAGAYKDAVFVCIIISFFFLYYSVLLPTPFYADDIYNSCIRGYINEQGITIWQYVWQENLMWMYRRRVFPLGMLQYVLFYYVNHVYLYKLYLIVFTIIIIYLLGKIVYKLSDSFYLKNSAMLLAGVLMPVYSYDGVNPMNMFGGLVHIVLLFGFSAVLLEICFLEQGKTYLLWLSAIFALCAMFTYEIGWVFPIILCVLAVLYSKKNVRSMLFAWVPYIVICGGGAVFTFVCKMFHHGQSYEGIIASFDLQKIWDTFCVQFFGAIPFINWRKAAKPAYLNTDLSYIFKHTDVLSVVIAIGLIGCVIWNAIVSEKKTMNKKTYAACLCTGGILWAVPSLLIAVSGKYQRELTATQLPYLPYFMEIFGLCLIVLLFFMTRHRKAVFVSNLFLCAWMAIVPPYFRYAVNELNISSRMLYKQPRELLADAAKNGLFDDVPEDGLVVLDNRFVPCVSCNIFSTVKENLKTDYYLYQSGRWIKQAGKLKQNKLECSEDNVYLVKTYITDTIEIASASRIQKIEINKEKEITGIYADRVNLYVRILDDTANTTCSAVYYDGNNENAVGFDLKDYMSDETKAGEKEKRDYRITFEGKLFDYYRFIF